MQTLTKSQLWQALKARGATPAGSYIKYSVADLQDLYDEHMGFQAAADEDAPLEPLPDAYSHAATEEALAGPLWTEQPEAVPEAAPAAPAARGGHAGAALEPLRVDEQGREWLIEELTRPGGPAPRARKLIRYNDPGVETLTFQDGTYTETVEVPGSRTKAAEARITLPVSQVGRYRTKRYPFDVHTYRGAEVFDFRQVIEYYGGAEFVPETIHRKYVDNVLGFDIPSVIATIQREYRELSAKGLIR